MKNKLKNYLGIICFCLAIMMFVCACGTGEKVTITFKNGSLELGSVTVKAGKLVTGYEEFENLDGYTFLGWYETPSLLKSSKVDFSTATFEKDKLIFGSFKSNNVAEDTRTWTICGTGSSPALATSNWNNKCKDDSVTFVATGKNPNEFQLTLDLFAGDQFQIINEYGWNDQRGFGCFTEIDETQFENGGGLSGSDKKSNVNVLMDGNYTITLSTDPDNSLQDIMKIVRNGNPIGKAKEPEAKSAYVVSDKTQVMVKGSWVADWSDVKALSKKGETGIFSIQMELPAQTELYFMIWDDGLDTGLGLKYDNVTDDTKSLLEDSYNVKVAADGTYTFEVDANLMTIKVSK